MRIHRALPWMAALGVLPLLWSQGSALLTVAPPAKLIARRNAVAETKLSVQVRSGYHVNSNAPADDYLIPLRLTWDAGPLKPIDTVYPKPELQKYDFSDKPVSVFTGDFSLTARFKTDASAPAGPGVLFGKLRYQACSNDTCYPPKTIEIRQPYSIQ